MNFHAIALSTLVTAGALAQDSTPVESTVADMQPIKVEIIEQNGKYRQTPYRDGTTQVAFDPVDFIARLAALVPKPRVNLTRYHGVLAPNHRWRGLVTPAKRGKGAMRPVDSDVVSSIQRHAAMTWAQRLKRVFNIDIEVCGRCGGSVRVIACIEDQGVIPDKAGQALDRILAHLESKEQNTPTLPHLAPPTRASPETR